MKEVLRTRTKDELETQKFGKFLAEEILKLKSGKSIVLGLEGELGAGKTTFAKGFARGLHIKEAMKSPTFILMRAFKIPRTKKHLLHFDAYRIDDPKEFLHLGFKDLLKEPSNVLLVEWSDKIKKLLPKDYFRLVFKVAPKHAREISLWV